MSAYRLNTFASQTARMYTDLAAVGAQLPEAPHASLAHGAAGVAYWLMRHAEFGGDPSSLEAADHWVGRAEADGHHAQAFTTIDERLTDLPAESLLYHEPGVRWMRARVAAAGADRTTAVDAAARFATAADAVASRDPHRDVMFGVAGLLLGCAQLVESIDDIAAIRPVATVGARLAADLSALIARDGGRLDGQTFGYLGASHGWAGASHALLRWSSATASSPSPEALALLDRLGALRRRSGRWPLRVGSRIVWRGWCHGSAGWAQVWALASQVTGDGQLLDIAAQCADDAVAAEEDGPSLCCGRAGQGFAALTMFRATGDRRWVADAERALASAVRGLDDLDEPPQRLFSGALGVALLAAELEDPGRAAMPVFGAA